MVLLRLKNIRPRRRATRASELTVSASTDFWGRRRKTIRARARVSRLKDIKATTRRAAAHDRRGLLRRLLHRRLELRRLLLHRRLELWRLLHRPLLRGLLLHRRLELRRLLHRRLLRGLLLRRLLVKLIKLKFATATTATATAPAAIATKITITTKATKATAHARRIERIKGATAIILLAEVLAEHDVRVGTAAHISAITAKESAHGDVTE